MLKEIFVIVTGFMSYRLHAMVMISGTINLQAAKTFHIIFFN